MRKLVAIITILCLLCSLTGCEAFKKKFTRKKKATVKMPRIYQVKKYEKKPTPELYMKHYNFWVSWQSEIEKDLGQNRKRDIRCIDEIISNLSDMRNMLVPEKADTLQRHIAAMETVKDVIEREELSSINKAYVIRTLDREGRRIKKDFTLTKVKGYLKKSFDDAEQPQQPATESAGEAVAP